MDILGEFKVDEIVDVNIIKVIPVRTVKPIVPHVYKYKLKIHEPQPTVIKYQYVSTDFIIDLEEI